MFCLCPQGSQKELLNLTQQDYVNRIEELNQSLKDAWASDQKVKALKIVIQVRLREGVWLFISSVFRVKFHLVLIFRVLPQGLALIHLFCGRGRPLGSHDSEPVFVDRRAPCTAAQVVHLMVPGTAVALDCRINNSPSAVQTAGLGTTAVIFVICAHQGLNNCRPGCLWDLGD